MEFSKTRKKQLEKEPPLLVVLACGHDKFVNPQDAFVNADIICKICVKWSKVVEFK